MKLSERIKTYNFWVSLTSAIFLIIKVLGTQIGFNVDESLFSDLITSICSILVLLGIIVPPKNPETKLKNNIETISIQNISENINNVSDNIVLSSNEVLNTSTSNEEMENDIAIDDNMNNIEKLTIDNCEIQETILNDDHSIDLTISNLKDDNNDENQFNLTSQKDILAEELNAQEKLFENNIEDYINILQSKVNELKCK